MQKKPRETDAIQINTLEFLKEALNSFTSSLNINIVLENIFAFLSTYFPIESFSIHKYNSERKSILLMYYVNKKGCHYIKKEIKLSVKEQSNMLEIQQDKEVYWEKLSATNMFNFLSKHFTPHLGYAECECISSMLRTNNQAIGNLIFFGKENIVFNPIHVELFTQLLQPFTSIMINLLHYQEVLELQNHLASENKKLSQNIEDLKMQDVIGVSKGFRKVSDMVTLLSDKEAPVLLLGETGTGKEIVADMIQKTSKRKNKVFIKVNCGALPETLIDSELFGYEKGAFTGAFETKMGKFEQADGGTLFLDEIGELPLQAQVRLLRVLQFGFVERVGGTKSISIDVRIIAATNRNLEDMLQKGMFREDLYYRLHVFPIQLPPLRERKEDIPSFLAYFTHKVSLKHSLSVPAIDYANIIKLQSYSWPGNIRELQNLVERTLILNPSSPVDYAQHLPQDPGWYLDAHLNAPKEYFKTFIKECVEEVMGESSLQVTEKKPLSVDELMKQQIIDALKKCQGKVYGKNGAAELLNMNYHTLKKRIAKLQINCKKLWE